MELLQRLAAIIPRPRIHLIRYHDILTPNAKGRAQVIPKQLSEQIENIAPPAGIIHEQDTGTPKCYRAAWAKLLKRVFDIDMEHCPHCGGAMKILAALEAPFIIRKIFSHLGIPAHPQEHPSATIRMTKRHFLQCSERISDTHIGMTEDA